MAANTGEAFIMFDLLQLNNWKIEKKHEPDSAYIFQDFAISPDNNWIVYTSNMKDILLQSLSSSSPQIVKDNLSHVNIYGWLIHP